MDHIDRDILRRLLANGRMTNASLAKEVGLSASATFERHRRLEESGVIQGYTARVDPKSVGRGLEVFMTFTLKNQNPAEVERFNQAMLEREEVLDCSQVMGRFDFIARVAVRDIDELRSFINEHLIALGCIDRMETQTVLGMIKRNHPPYPRAEDTPAS